ncbi:MAG: glycosyltransferase family 4 protein [Candidatus Thermoplasmatota archaeon]|nr:glycosyltransferase family 4 protein [Candidatus Thermoplasmatota archaeon]
MKVVIIYGNPIGKFYGGISTHIKYLTNFLSYYADINIFLLTFGEKNFTYKKNNIQYIELKRMKFGKFFYPFEIYYDLFRLEREIKKINPDLIHIQSTSPNFSLFGIYMLKKYPILITLHGYFNKEYKVHVGWRKIFYRLFCVPIERFALSKIPNIIVLCPQIKDMISKITRSKIFIIPNGIDIDYIQKINSYEKKNYPTIFFLGYLTKGKGTKDLIRAIQLVKVKINNVKLYIGGIGPDMTKLQKLVQDLNLKDNVTFLGLLDYKEKFAYMKSMDVFVLPSYWESFPIVLLEAMACGKPIITTDVGGNPYAVSDKLNGFLVKPGQWQQIAEHLIYLLHDKNLLNKMGQESKKRSINFNWEIIAQNTRDVYKEITTESRDAMFIQNFKK